MTSPAHLRVRPHRLPAELFARLDHPLRHGLAHLVRGEPCPADRDPSSAYDVRMFADMQLRTAADTVICVLADIRAAHDTDHGSGRVLQRMQYVLATHDNVRPLLVSQKEELEPVPQQPPTTAGDLWEGDVDEPVGEVTAASKMWPLEGQYQLVLDRQSGQQSALVRSLASDRPDSAMRICWSQHRPTVPS